MTVHLSDAFEASGGGLNNRVPPLNLNSPGVWSNTDGRLAQDADGRLVCTYGTDPTGSGDAQCPVGNPAGVYSASSLSTGEVSMVLRRDASSWTGYYTGARLGVRRENEGGYMSTTSVILSVATLPNWSLKLYDNSQGNFATWDVTFDADTDYTLKLAFSDTVLTATFGGQTYTANTPVFNGAGLRVDALAITVGNTLRIDSVEMTDGVAVPPSTARAWAPAALGAPKVLADTVVPLPVAHASAASPLQAAHVVAHTDFTGLLGNALSVYVMDLITPTGTVRVPMSSWQATLQTGASNYVQCVVPACTMWVAALAAATEFVIYRRAVLPSGEAIEQEMARAPASTAQYDRGPARHTCTLSGYSTAFVANAEPDAAYDRTLTGVRSVSSGSSMRVRCAVDWLLRPGQRAFVDGTPLLVGYINYYAPSGFDSYMDVGEQA